MPLSDEFYLREIVKLLAGPDGEGADALETIYRAIQAASGGGGGGGGGGGSFGPDTSIQMTVQNKSGDTLVKGSSVALTWVETGAHPAVIDFRDSDPDGRDHVLGVLAETIADNAVGLCTVRGPLTGIDTSGFSLGAVIYAGSPAGPSGWVAGFPASPYSHQLGVITVVDATVGEIYVLPEEASVPDHGHTGPGDGGGGGGERVIYSHTCDGQEIVLAIPFPESGKHAVIRLLVDVPVGLMGFLLGAATDQWQSVDPNPAGLWIFKIELNWFRVALAGWLTALLPGNLQGGTLFSTNGQPLTAFDLSPYDEGTGDPMPFPAGTLVEVAVS